MRLALVTLFAGLLLAAPASAQMAASPTVIPFAAGQRQPAAAGDAHVSSECGAAAVENDGWDNGPYMNLTCGYPFIDFARPQAMVELFVRVPVGGPEVTMV